MRNSLEQSSIGIINMLDFLGSRFRQTVFDFLPVFIDNGQQSQCLRILDNLWSRGSGVP